MSTAIKEHTTPTRRSAMRFSLAALTAGLTVPAIAAPSTTATPDATLINLCDRLVAIETERQLLTEHDDWAPEFGPNHARYEQLSEELHRLQDLIEEYQSPVSAAGISAVARVALTWADYDNEGNILCADFNEDLMAKLAEGAAPGFIWPPRPGSCSTAHWAPPPSPQEVDEHSAAAAARWAEVDAKAQAKREAEAAEHHRRMTTSLLTDEELRGRIEASRKFQAIADQIDAELDAEMARRGLA